MLVENLPKARVVLMKTIEITGVKNIGLGPKFSVINDEDARSFFEQVLIQ